jgi:DNA-binding NarL/FixJ family response regulator
MIDNTFMGVSFSHRAPVYAACQDASSQQTVRLLLADDHTLYRQGLRQACESQSDIQIVGEVQDGLAAVELALALRPDVILMDIKMPGLDGIQATTRIAEKAPEIGVVILTIYHDAQHILEALQAGARAHLLKDVNEETLFQVIRAVARGEALIDSQVTGLLLDRFRYISQE